MLELITSIFNRVYTERKSNNPDKVPANDITPKFMQRVEELLKMFDDGRCKVFACAASNTSVIFKWNKVEYYVRFVWKSDNFKTIYY